MSQPTDIIPVEDDIKDNPHISDDGVLIARRLHDIEVQQEKMQETLNHILGVMQRTEDIITKVAAEVMPSVNALMEHPMFKMLARKKA